jgi:hypothetical protein
LLQVQINGKHFHQVSRQRQCRNRCPQLLRPESRCVSYNMAHQIIEVND